MQHTGFLELSCPAKVNLALYVGAPCTDGLHPLASWMVALRFADTLTLQHHESGNDSRFDIRPIDESVDGRGFTGTSSPRISIDWPIEEDLVYRAHRLMEQHVGSHLPVHLKLRKRIPAGAGLGGGSSNAAATLVGLNHLFDLGLPDQTLIPIARRLGSDVVFCYTPYRVPALHW